MGLDIALKIIKQKIYELNRNEPRMHRNSHLRLGFHFCNIHLSVYRFGSIACDKSASSLTLPNTDGFLWISPAVQLMDHALKLCSANVPPQSVTLIYEQWTYPLSLMPQIVLKHSEVVEGSFALNLKED